MRRYKVIKSSIPVSHIHPIPHLINHSLSILKESTHDLIHTLDVENPLGRWSEERRNQWNRMEQAAKKKRQEKLDKVYQRRRELAAVRRPIPKRLAHFTAWGTSQGQHDRHQSKGIVGL